MYLIDTHCHLDFKIFDQDRCKMLDQAYLKGVRAIINPAITVNNFTTVLSLPSHNIKQYPTFGLHPCFIDQHQNKDLIQLEMMIQTHSPIALGECGLDFFLEHLKTPEYIAKQLFLFEAQLKLAQKYNLPVIIHARKSLDKVIQLIIQTNKNKQFNPLKGIIHCFSGSSIQAKKIIELGFYMGWGGPITYPRATHLHMLIKTVPLTHILLESDAPDQPIFQAHNSVNTPQTIYNVCQKIAELRQCSFEHIANQTTKNAHTLFQLS